MNCSHESHAALKQPESWKGLAYVGVQELGDVKLLMKDCPHCHSTLCVELEDCEHEHAR